MFPRVDRDVRAGRGVRVLSGDGIRNRVPRAGSACEVVAKDHDPKWDQTGKEPTAVSASSLWRTG